MAGLEKLDLPQLALVVEFFDIEIFAGVNDCLHHHILEPGFLCELDDLAAILDRRGHRHRAGHVFAGLQCLDRLRGVIRNGRVDMHRIDLGIAQQLIIVGIAFLDPEGVLNGLQFLRVALADGHQVGVGMRLIDGNKFGAEAEADDRKVDFFMRHEWDENWKTREIEISQNDGRLFQREEVGFDFGEFLR